MAARKQQKQSIGIESSRHESVLEAGRPSLASLSHGEEPAGASGEDAPSTSNDNPLRKVEAVYTRRSRRISTTTKVTIEERCFKNDDKISVATAEILSSQEEVVKVVTTSSAKVSRRKKVVGKPKQGSDNGDKILVASTEEEIEKPTVKLDNGSKKSVMTCEDTSLQGERTSKGSGKSSRKRESDAVPCQQSEGEMAVTIEMKETEVLVEKRDPWLLLVHKKVQSDWSVYNPVTMRRPKLSSSSVKIVSWNVNGLRALLKGKGDQEAGSTILKLAQREDFDVVCLQETKLQEKDVPTIKEAILPGYNNSFWSCSTAKLGYSGTAIISRIAPLSVSYGLGVSNHDKEGRIITIEFDKFFLVTGYVPNSGQKLERLAYRTQDWDSSLATFLKDLEQQKPVILTGDLNCAHQEIDIHNPDGNRRSAGFTDEERASFEKSFLEKGLIDTFRRQHPNVVGYTYWGYRTAARPKNQGWRLDYFLASESLVEHIHDSYILPDVEGSDHCPIGLILKA